MEKECVFNELSMNDVDVRSHDILTLWEKLSKLREAVRPGRFALWAPLLDSQTIVGKRFNEIKLAAQPRRPEDRDRWRQFLSLLSSAEDFAEEYAEEARFGEDPSVGAPGHSARGLWRAQRQQALALSLATAGRWNAFELPITLFKLPLLEEGEPTLRKDIVRHASEEAHLAAHADWPPLDEVDRLRIALMGSTTHVPASGYRAGKHVAGRTNEQRAENARQPAGVSQYMAFTAGQNVTDDTIRYWEKLVLERVKQGGACTVERRGVMYWVFCDLGTPVGYEGGTGEVISSVRVEWSGGHVHSHPRQRA